MRVIGLHQKRPVYPSQLTRFPYESKDFSPLLAYVVNLPAYAGIRLSSKVTYLVWSTAAIFNFQTSQNTCLADLLRRVDRFQKNETSLNYTNGIYNLKPAHFLPYGKCNFTYSLVTHFFRATFLLLRIVSAQAA